MGVDGSPRRQAESDRQREVDGEDGHAKWDVDGQSPAEAQADLNDDAGYADLAALLFGDLPPSDLARFVHDLDRILTRLRDRQSANAGVNPTHP